MREGRIREPEEIRASCAAKLRALKAHPHLMALLGCLVSTGWTIPRIMELRVTPARHLLARMEGHISFRPIPGNEGDLIRLVHHAAKLARLDGDETGHLLAEIAKIRRHGQPA